MDKCESIPGATDFPSPCPLVLKLGQTGHTRRQCRLFCCVVFAVILLIVFIVSHNHLHLGVLHNVRAQVYVCRCTAKVSNWVCVCPVGGLGIVYIRLYCVAMCDSHLFRISIVTSVHSYVFIFNCKFYFWVPCSLQKT